MCYGEKEIEIEKDIEKDIEIDKKENIKEKTEDVTDVINGGGQMSRQMGDKNPPEIEIKKEEQTEKNSNDFSDIVKFYENNIELITQNKAMILSEYLDKFNKDIIIYAIQIAVEDKARNIKYIETILENWLKANIKSLEEAKDYTKKLKDYKANKNSKNNTESVEDRVKRLFGGNENNV